MIKSILNHRTHLTRLGVVLLLFVPLSWAASEMIVGIFSRYLEEKNEMLLRLCMSAIFTSLAYIAAEIIYAFFTKNHLILLESNISSKFDAEIEKCGILRVFASSGNAAKNELLRASKLLINRKNLLEVKVLFRGDNTPARREHLNKEISQWKTYLAPPASKNIRLSFSIYDGPFMLGGFIFDDESAFLSWYSRTNTFNSSPSMPKIILYKDTALASELLAQAISTFDDHFDRGQV